METVAIDNQIAIIENSIEVFKSGPRILTANKTRADKAIQVGKNILADIQANGMTPELDQRANNYLANVTKACKEMKEGRAEVTQIMDELKKMFTKIENDLDVKKPETIPAHIQQARDIYAKELALAKKRKEEEAQRIADKAKEAIEIKAALETGFLRQYNEYLLSKKKKMQDLFNALTLSDFDEKGVDENNVLAFFKGLKPKYVFVGKPDAVICIYHTAEDQQEIFKSIVEIKTNELSANYSAEMSLQHADLIAKLPSKHNELLEQKRLADEAEAARQAAIKAEEERQADMAKAGAQRKKELEAEAAKAREKEAARQAEYKVQQEKAASEQKAREEADAARLAKEAQEAQEKAAQVTEMNKQTEQTMILFEKEASLSESSDAPEARQGYDITVTHQAGYVQIFQFYFDKQGKSETIDKLGKTSLDQMKAFCEKTAHKSGEMIDSKFLKYEPTFKAVNRKLVK